MAQTLQETWQQLKTWKQSITQALQEFRMEEALSMIRSYSATIGDVESCAMLATWHFQNGDYGETIRILQEAADRHPYNFEIMINLGIVHEAAGSLESAILSYAYAAKLGRTEQEVNQCTDKIRELARALSASQPVDRLLAEVQDLLNAGDNRGYPFDAKGHSLIRKAVNHGTGHEAMANLYQTCTVQDVDSNNRLYFKAESVKGRRCIDETIELSEPSILPLSLIRPGSKVLLEMNGKSYAFRDNPLAANRFHYFKFDEPGALRIRADQPVFVGKPLAIHDKPKKPRLILKIFIDGLSYHFLRQNGLATLMPNTAAFFGRGMIADRAYLNSEWTLPSKASIHTGLYATSHLMLHPTLPAFFRDGHKLLAEYLNEAGYHTAWICSNWRTTPSMGYQRGIDRFLYRNFFGGSDCKDMVMEAIEHLASFEGKNNYLAISIMDLHHVADEIEEHLYAEVRTDMALRPKGGKKGATSVLSKYDEAKIAKYGLEIARIDLFLGVLYDFLQKRYADEDMLVILHSDHGQSYLEDADHLYHEGRTRIPFMMRGAGVPSMVSDEWIESVDILPAILKTAGIGVPDGIDGRVPACLGGGKARDHVIMQFLHPNQTYKAVIKDDIHDFIFESADPVNSDLTFNLENAGTRLINRATGQDEVNEYATKAAGYEARVFELAKRFHRWKAD